MAQTSRSNPAIDGAVPTQFSPEIRTEFGRSDEHRWIQRYGFEEVTVGKPDDDAVEDGRNSRRRSFRKVTRERPGLVPSALFDIIANTVFLRLADVASGLPDYDEQILLSSMDSEEDATGYSQRSAYNTVYEELRLKLAEALKAGSKRLLATYLQTLLAYPNGCTRGETVFDPRSGDVIVQVPPLFEERLYPKGKPDAVLEVAYRILDLGVTAMIGLHFQRLHVPVGDEAVIAVGGDESQLRTGRRLHPPDDEPYRAASASAWNGV